MLALLLTSIGLLGLIQTQRALLHGQRLQAQQLAAWRDVRSALALASQPVASPPHDALPPGWQRAIRTQEAGGCRLLIGEVTPPLGPPVSLVKLICP